MCVDGRRFYNFQFGDEVWIRVLGSVFKNIVVFRNGTGNLEMTWCKSSHASVALAELELQQVLKSGIVDDELGSVLPGSIYRILTVKVSNPKQVISNRDYLNLLLQEREKQ